MSRRINGERTRVKSLPASVTFRERDLPTTRFQRHTSHRMVTAGMPRSIVTVPVLVALGAIGFVTNGSAVAEMPVVEVATAPLAEAAPPPSPPVAVERDRITGSFVGVSAEDALRQIASATGADVVGTVLEGRQITVK